MKLRKNRFSLYLSVAVFAMTAASANAEVLRWGHSSDITTMDPQGHYTTLNGSFLGNVYEGLVRVNRELKIEPALATSWEQVDSSTLRFTLREGVTFHNGNPFNADDVVASLLRASDEKSAYRPATYWIAEVKKVDDYTVDVISNMPHPTALNDLTGVFIMDEEWMVENNSLRAINLTSGEESYATANSNGTGPFKLVRRRPDVETHLTVHEEWWDEKEHNLTEVYYRPIASDATRVSALLSGELDFITPAPLQDVDRVNSADGRKSVVVNNTRVYVLNFELGDKLHNSNVTDENPLTKPEVRQALYQAIDFDLLASRVMRGMTTPTAAFVAPQIQGYSAELEKRPMTYDPQAAQVLLAEAGYADGFELGFDCPQDSYVNAEQLCQVITTMWGQIGVTAKLNITPYSIFTTRVLNGETDIFLNAWANTPQLDALSFLNNVVRTGGTWNPGSHSNSEIDALIEDIRVELDMEKRTELMTEAFRIYQQTYAAIPLFTEPFVWGMVENFDIPPTADARVRLYWANFN